MDVPLSHAVSSFLDELSVKQVYDPELFTGKSSKPRYSIPLEFCAGAVDRQSPTQQDSEAGIHSFNINQTQRPEIT